MQYLLDTHAILWYAQGSNELSSNARSLMENETCYYSILSLWEIALKQKLGKINTSLTMQDLDAFCKNAGFISIITQPSHVEQTKTLDFIHKDPFDRLLIAQAQTEGLTIITKDTIIPQYNVKTVW